MSRLFLLICGTWFLAGCGAQPIASTERHINAENNASVAPDNIPQPVRAIPLPPPPKPQPKAERYSVVVNNVPVQELLFALARDAKVNVDIHPGIEGRVSLNAIDQTLPQILTRLAKQTDLRFELDGPNLVVMPDTPYLKSYKIDYVNIARNSTGTVGISTKIATTGNTTQSNSSGSSSGDNGSTTMVSNTSNNKFWETLTQNLKDILRETDKVFPEGSFEKQTTNNEQKQKQTKQPTLLQKYEALAHKALDSALLPSNTKEKSTTSITSPREEVDEESRSTVERSFNFREAASVISNPEAGIINVRATSRQHEKVQEFIDRVIGSAKRQVLIEATIVEVTLNDQFRAGIDWSRLMNLGDGKFTASQSFTSGNFSSTPVFTLFYSNPNSSVKITSTIQLLSTFGNTRVLSSPKIMTLNNQTALLKVVDENVYFTLDVRTTEPTGLNSSISRTVTSKLNSVPIGIVMSVTPQIGDNGDVSLNVRPTISRISSFINDPTLAVQTALSGAEINAESLTKINSIVNRIPQIQVREFESVLRVPSGQTVVLGGLMQDSEVRNKNGAPGISDVPIVGNAFKYQEETSNKSELVIFLRPIIVGETNSDNTLQDYQGLLPNNNFFRPEKKSTSQEAQGRQP